MSLPHESAELREKRLELKELEATKEFGGPLYDQLHASLLEDIADLEGQPAPPRVAPPKPTPTMEAPVAAKPLSELNEDEREARRAYQREWKARKRAEEGAPKVKVPKAAKKAAAPQESAAPQAQDCALDRPLELAIDLGRAIERHVTTAPPLDDIRASIRGTRRQIWSLLASLENLTPSQLVQLQDEVALLDSASATAYQMVQKAVA